MSPTQTGQSISEDYSHIELTEDDLNEARRKKFNDAKIRDYIARVKSDTKWEIPTARLLYDGLMATQSRTGGYYQVTDDNRNIIHALCLYFSNDPRFEKQFPQFSLNNGICLSGNPGTGKTHLMEYFQMNPKQCYRQPICKEIAEKFRTDFNYEGQDTIEYYSSIPKAKQPSPFNQEQVGFCFSDLGTEDDKNNFGNKMNVMEEIILMRYEKKVPFHFTHFTSNLGAQQIQDRYGVRFRDRIKESCNWMVMTGKSFR